MLGFDPTNLTRIIIDIPSDGLVTVLTQGLDGETNLENAIDKLINAEPNSDERDGESEEQYESGHNTTTFGTKKFVTRQPRERRDRETPPGPKTRRRAGHGVSPKKIEEIKQRMKVRKDNKHPSGGIE